MNEFLYSQLSFPPLALFVFIAPDIFRKAGSEDPADSTTGGLVLLKTLTDCCYALDFDEHIRVSEPGHCYRGTDREIIAE